MPNRRPVLNKQKKICIICEGYEEYEYLEKVVSLNIWNRCYKFDLVNAESNGNIPARYQEKYMSDSYDLVIVFCDTDQKPFEDYDLIKKKINTIHGFEAAAELVVIFANPCTMQIILLHFGDVELTSHKKADNREAIKQLTGVASYNAKAKQRNQINEQITVSNYHEMMSRSEEMSLDDSVMGSSNFHLFASRFTGDSVEWTVEVNKQLESC
jgi:hypothetical protein